MKILSINKVLAMAVGAIIAFSLMLASIGYIAAPTAGAQAGFTGDTRTGASINIEELIILDALTRGQTMGGAFTGGIGQQNRLVELVILSELFGDRDTFRDDKDLTRLIILSSLFGGGVGGTQSAVIQQPVVTQPTQTTHVVVSGDTMSSIAATYGVTLSALIAANPQVLDPNFIVPGQVITIPGTTSSTTFVPTVVSAGTVGAGGGVLGQSNLVELIVLSELFSDRDTFRSGGDRDLTRLILLSSLFGGGIGGIGGGVYVVQSGDTMAGIAARHGVSLSALIAANPQIANPNLIFPGQRVVIPRGVSGTGVLVPGGNSLVELIIISELFKR